MTIETSSCRLWEMSTPRGRTGVQTLRFLGALAEAGVFKPVIDRTCPFSRIVDTHAYVDTGHRKGNVVITLE